MGTDHGISKEREMIAKFWEALFDYADKVKEEGDETRYEIVHEIEDILQKAYDGGMDNKTMVTDWNPGDKVGKLVGSIPDIEIYKDPNDGKMFWELDGRYFDYPEEVIKYLIEFRSNEAIREMGRFRGRFLAAIYDSIEDFGLVKALEGKKRKIIEGRPI